MVRKAIPGDFFQFLERDPPKRVAIYQKKSVNPHGAAIKRSNPLCCRTKRHTVMRVKIYKYHQILYYTIVVAFVKGVTGIKTRTATAFLHRLVEGERRRLGLWQKG